MEDFEKARHACRGGTLSPLTSRQRREAFERFVEQYEGSENLEPPGLPLAYDPIPHLHSASWRPLEYELVTDDLRELTNFVNRWHESLQRWHAWNLSIADQTEDEIWAVQWEFIEPVALECMLQPSAMRDRFTMVATNALHQVRLVISSA